MPDRVRRHSPFIQFQSSLSRIQRHPALFLQIMLYISKDSDTVISNRYFRIENIFLNGVRDPAAFRMLDRIIHSSGKCTIPDISHIIRERFQERSNILPEPRIFLKCTVIPGLPLPWNRFQTETGISAAFFIYVIIIQTSPYISSHRCFRNFKIIRRLSYEIRIIRADLVKHIFLYRCSSFFCKRH